MGLFKKKNNDFIATKTFYGGSLQYNDDQNIIKITNGFKKDLIPVNTITSATVAMNGTHYDLNDLKTIRNGIISGTFTKDINNIQLCIKAEKNYVLPLTIGKQSADKAERILNSANQMLSFILDLI